MKEYQSLTHARWDCKYHAVLIPKGRKKAIFGAVRKHLGYKLHELAKQKECKIVEGHWMPDQVHMCIASTLAFGELCREVYQGQERNRHSPKFFRQDEELRR